MKFHKIVAVDRCGLVGPARRDILDLSATTAVEFDDDPPDNAEIIARIGDADCVLVSWRTKLGRDVLAACPNLRYVGMCCSLYDEASANVDIAAALEYGIVVKGVRDYGDEGTVEFIFAQLVCLYKGMGLSPWRGEPGELGGKCLGVVGMGTVGRMVADTARHFGMRTVYYSRTRKPEVEAAGTTYLELDGLLPVCDVVSLHLPRSARILGEREFALMRDGAVLVNTSLGRPLDMAAFSAWLRRSVDNYGIFDGAGAEALLGSEERHPRLLLYPRSSGFTVEARARLSGKVLHNMREFLDG